MCELSLVESLVMKHSSVRFL